MKKEAAKKRIEKLRKVINDHRYLYHVLDKPEISDDAFDSLKHELYQLERKYPDLITPGSPTQRVGGKPLEKFEKLRHSTPMLSIEDVFEKEDLCQWEDYLKRLYTIEQIEYFCELKIDGFAISLIYEDGSLALGVTRGDGRVGENVTQNIKTIQTIPLNLHIYRKLPDKEIEDKLKKAIKKGRFEIRGEVYMTKDDFKKINQERVKKGEAPYANPRNLAAGSIRQLDPKLAASRNLKFSSYDMVSDVGQKTHFQEHEIVSCLGFKSEKGKVCKNLEEVVNYWREVQKKRNALPFQVDGLVILVNDNSLFEKLGVAGKSPRGIRAFKFTPKQATTKIRDIKIQIGRTGAATPVAILEPVKVGGVTITRATLHNEDEIKKLGLRIGDTVIVERAGDVIPIISKVLADLRSGREKAFRMPRICPMCKNRLERPEGEVISRCPNPVCLARKKEQLHHFVSKKAFDIEGLGPKIIDQLLENNLVSEPADFFEIKEGDLIPLDRFAETSANNLVGSIKKSKRIPLSRFIFSLGIRHVGEETAIDLAQYFGSLEKLRKASIEELNTLPNIGSVVARSIHGWFREKDNLSMLNRFQEVGIMALPPQNIRKVLQGESFIITGTLGSMSRQQAYQRIRSLGGDVVSSVSRNTNYLIVGRNPGSKLEKAKKLGIKIISEEELLNLLRT